MLPRLPTIKRVIAVPKEGPQGSELMVAGNYNTKLAQLEVAERDEEIAEGLVVTGL